MPRPSELSAYFEQIAADERRLEVEHADRVARARATGEPLVETQLGSARITYRVEDGRTFWFQAGVVELYNAPETSFDFRVRMSAGDRDPYIEVGDDGLEREYVPSGRPTVQEVTVMRRAGIDAARITRRNLAAVPLGEVRGWATAALTGGEVIVGQEMAQRMGRRSGRPTRGDRTADDVEAVADAIRRADAEGGVRFDAAKAVMKDRWRSDPERSFRVDPSDRWVRTLIARAIEDHGLPPGKRGRPPGAA